MLLRLLVLLAEFLFTLLVVRLVLARLAPWLWAVRAQRHGPPRATELVRDSVCNTFLPRERALKAWVFGREQHFCSAACRDRALGAAAREAVQPPP